MASKTVNITTEQSPVTDSKFSEQKANANLGPEPVLSSNVSLEKNALQPVVLQNAAIWNPMTAFEEDLKTALVDFIDTTKEGVKFNKNFRGRAKILDFFFTGTATKSVRPAEVGHFRLVLSYPPNIINQNTTINNSNL